MPIKLAKPSMFLMERYFDKFIPITCGVIFLGAMGIALNPSLSHESAYADADISAQVDGTPTLTLSLNDAVNTNGGQTTVAEVGKLASMEYQFNVTAINTNGYSIYVQSAAGYDNMLHGLANPQEKIEGVGDNVLGSSDAFTNKWGYNLSNTTIAQNINIGNRVYNTLPKNGDTISPSHTGSNTTENGTDWTLTFAVRFGQDKPADHYQTKVLLSAMMLPDDIVELSMQSDKVVYMQDMTPEICANTPEGYSKRLVDNRDNKTYWVAKLADDNCWMVQNLALEITDEMINNEELNSTNTDIAFVWGKNSAWTDKESWKALSDDYTDLNYPGDYIAPSKTEREMPEVNDLASDTDYITTRSWGFGDYVIVNPTNGTGCGTIGSDRPLTDCNTIKQIDDSMTADFEATLTEGYRDKQYDAHYLIGNYYQFNAATAGTGRKLSTSNNTSEYGLNNAAGSICPKGWTLPKAGYDPTSEDPDTALYPVAGSFYALISKYGYTQNYKDVDVGPYTTISRGVYRADYQPFYLIRSGAVNLTYGAVTSLGSHGHIWSSTMHQDVNSSKFSYNLYISPSNIYPSGIFRQSHYFGLPVRCVARW